MTVRPRYIAKYTRSSQKHKEYDENSMGKRGSLSAKGKCDYNLLVVSLKL